MTTQISATDVGKMWFLALFVMFASAALPILVLPAVILIFVACWATIKAMMDAGE